MTQRLVENTLQTLAHFCQYRLRINMMVITFFYQMH